MHVHILGICGSFMGGIAAIAKSLGHTVTGSDRNVYPPMSTQLEALGITLTEGYDPAQFEPVPDMVIIGNAMSRGSPRCSCEQLAAAVLGCHAPCMHAASSSAPRDGVTTGA